MCELAPSFRYLEDSSPEAIASRSGARLPMIAGALGIG